ncbi:MAG TPA: hypothetical protein VNM92_17180 [Thermoanaerobaculia bacterium]|nr:hypothetical protein [Thermoanaerobaculia bacterium]
MRRPQGAPEITLVQVSNAANLGMQVSGGVPVQYRLSVNNTFDYPIRLTLVEIQSVGELGAYALRNVRHEFDVTIPANTSDAIEIRAWVRSLHTDLKSDNSSPVLLRGTARFDTERGSFNRNFSGRGH